MKMRNILENKFWWAARSFAAVVFFSVSTLSANVFITEIADPNNDDAGDLLSFTIVVQQILI